MVEAERCVVVAGISTQLLDGDGGTRHTAAVSSRPLLLLVGVLERSQLAPISDMGTDALAKSSFTKRFSLNVCGVGGTTKTLTDISNGCSSLASITINVTSSFFSRHKEFISDFWVKVGWRCELMEVIEALKIEKGFNQLNLIQKH